MYERGLAQVHDAGFGAFARAAAPVIIRRLREAGMDDGLVVDLGCGSGILAAELIEAGYDVLGVDVSGSMIAIARRRAPEGRFLRAALNDADLPPCVAVTAVGEILSYSGIGDGLLERVRAALAPGGLVLFDVATPGREPEPRRTWHEGDGWVVCLDAREESAEGRLTRRIATFTRDGDGGWRRSDETHTLTLHDPVELVGRLRDAGFRDAQVVRDGYGSGFQLPQGVAVIAARA